MTDACTAGAGVSIRRPAGSTGACPRLAAGGRHGSWYVRLELPAGMDGHRRRIRRGGYPSRKAALEVLARLRAPRPGDADARMLTVGDWLAHWLVTKTATAPSTVRGYAAHVRLYLDQYLGEVLLAELATAHVQAMFTAIIRQHHALGTPVSAATLTRIRATLRAALNAAIRRGTGRCRSVPGLPSKHGANMGSQRCRPIWQESSPPLGKPSPFCGEPAPGPA